MSSLGYSQESATPGPAVTQADDGHSARPGEADRVPTADPNEPAVTLAGESIGRRAVATVVGDSGSLQPERTLADRSVPGERGASPSHRGGEAEAMADEAPVDPAHPGGLTLAEKWQAAGTPWPKPVVPGDIAQAHTKDDWIAIEQVQLAAEAYYRIACHLGDAAVG
jgi:hypothetical protein